MRVWWWVHLGGGMADSEFAEPLAQAPGRMPEVQHPSARGLEARRRVSAYCHALSSEAWAVVHEEFPASILELDRLFRSIGSDIPVSDFGLAPGERDGETGTAATGTAHTVGKRRRVSEGVGGGAGNGGGEGGVAGGGGPGGGGWGAGTGTVDTAVQAASSVFQRGGGTPAGAHPTHGGGEETGTINASVAGPMSAEQRSRDGQADNGSLQTDNAALVGPMAYRGEETGDDMEYGATTPGARGFSHQMYDTAIGPQQGGFPPRSGGGGGGGGGLGGGIGVGAVQFEGVTGGPPQDKLERGRFEGLHSALSKALPRQFERIKREILEFIDAVGRVKLWIQLSIPRVEVGKGSEVEMMEDIVRELGRAEESAFAALELQTKYYVARGKLVSKVAKYPDSHDYPKAVKELDEKEWVNVRLCARDLRDHTILLYDLITKNIDSLWARR